jgi:hypothetical protein
MTNLESQEEVVPQIVVFWKHNKKSEKRGDKNATLKL